MPSLTTLRVPHPAGHQKGFCLGASVYDRSQAGSKRGYGTITAPGSLPGTWYVTWLAPGHRVTAIHEAYLELALIHHTKRALPTAMGQDILVILGAHKGKAGATVKRVRRTRPPALLLLPRACHALPH